MRSGAIPDHGQPGSTTGGLILLASALGFALYGAARHVAWLWRNAMGHEPR